MKKLTATFIALFVIWACNRSEYAQDEMYITSDQYAPTTAKIAQNQEEIKHDERKLIKDGYLRFETNDLDKTYAAIAQELSKYQGSYISSDATGNGYQTFERTIEVRIPAQFFDSFLAEISKDVKHFDQRNMNVRDVTEQYFDLDVRLKTKKELEERYLQLLQKATTIKDILEIEREVGELRADIEVMEGRLRLLNNQINLATINIQFYVRQANIKTGFSFEFKQSFRRGWENFLGFFIGLIHLWPFVLAASVVFFIIRRKLKSKK